MNTPVDKETLEKVIEERKSSNIKIRPKTIPGEYGSDLYLDRKGLIHRGGPGGEITDYIGLTEEQSERAEDPEAYMPRPR
jgi:hypothetical protein